MGAKVEAVAPRRAALIAKGMIYSPAHGDTAFTVPLFDDYLKRAMSGWRPKKPSPVKEEEPGFKGDGDRLTCRYPSPHPPTAARVRCIRSSKLR